jgi:multidrug efflux pump subunit AcrA (membrane-fusion protein)
VVPERFVDEGSMMAPNTAIVSVLDIGALTAVIHVIERDYPKIKVGQAATVIADAFPGKAFTGRIIRVAPLLKETSRQARVEIEIPNRESLLAPGMFVRVEIDFSRHDDATLIPLSAHSAIYMKWQKQMVDWSGKLKEKIKKK